MTKTDREKRPIYVRRRGFSLHPVGGEDGQALEQYPLDTELEISVKQRRSLPQLRLYWAILHRVVEATGRFASAEHLHDAIKAKLGYVRSMKLMDGSEVLATDSAALAAMDAKEFNEFFNKAVELMNQTFGFDVTQIGDAA
jgi:ferric-dicitrate binding protein FerR (iron transport regulator)